MKRLVDIVREDEDDDLEARLDNMLGDEVEEQQPDRDGCDIALVSDTVLYSRQNEVFYERSEAIVEAFKRLLAPSEISSDRISSTLVFDIYAKHLMQQYKKNINENAVYNIATENELKRILANDINLKLKGYPVS